MILITGPGQPLVLGLQPLDFTFFGHYGFSGFQLLVFPPQGKNGFLHFVNSLLQKLDFCLVFPLLRVCQRRFYWTLLII
jgi:hypothetical protein